MHNCQHVIVRCRRQSRFDVRDHVWCFGVTCLGEMGFVAHPSDITFFAIASLRVIGRRDLLSGWTPAARLEAVIATAAMNEVARSAWCREHGVYPTELETWKQDAIGGLGEPREMESVAVKQERRRIKELERELHRKDKALAETAALLVLSKKLAAIFHDGEDA